MARIFLSLGSNLGDRSTQLREAVKLIGEHKDAKIIKVSSVYETEPVGGVLQPSFYNIVVEVESCLSPREMLGLAKDIEERLKRTKTVRWGPRTVDVDILLYDDLLVSDEDLIIPHTEMLKRAFVLVPLAEIEPELILPGGPVRDYLLGVTDQHIEKIGSLT